MKQDMLLCGAARCPAAEFEPPVRFRAFAVEVHLARRGVAGGLDPNRHSARLQSVGKNARLNIRGQYIRLPNYGDAGHKTLDNWYTTLLNAHGKIYSDIEGVSDIPVESLR